MELPNLRSIKLDSVTNAVIVDVDELAHQVNDFRPLPVEVLQSVENKLLGERVYNSNAIEGNTLSLRETISILQAGSVLNVRRKREAQEVLGLKNAIESIQELMTAGNPVRDTTAFLSVHDILFREMNAGIAGRLRNEDVTLTGAKHQPPDASHVPQLLQSLFAQLGNIDDLGAIHVATWVHWGITRVHPFVDGNGRMARLWQDLILFQRRLTSAIIRQQDRTEYYQVLTTADDGDFNPLAQLIAQRVASTLQVYLSAQQEADSLKGWAAEVVGESAARSAEQRRLGYMRWKHQMELLRDAFERCAAQLTNASSGAIEIQLVQYPIIDQSLWEGLRTGAGAKQTWFFKLNCRRDRKLLRYFFFFGKHFMASNGHEPANIGPSVCLLVSEQDERTDERNARQLDELDNTPLTLREVLVSGTELIRKRRNNVNHEFVYDIPVDPIRLAQEFLQEVLLLRLA
ncbi:MAG: hypothetical protein EXS05_15295 [Planctomycetaceae bacterium]|nr:hypothetical protein [Planctomycetaceae bacterium]